MSPLMEPRCERRSEQIRYPDGISKPVKPPALKIIQVNVRSVRCTSVLNDDLNILLFIWNHLIFLLALQTRQLLHRLANDAQCLLDLILSDD